MQPNPNYQRYDIAKNARRIAEIDNPIARRQELEKVPRAYRAGMESAVAMLFRNRMSHPR